MVFLLWVIRTNWVWMLHLSHQLGEAAECIGFVEWGVDFVENAERAGLILEDPDQQGQGSHRFFSTGEQQYVL